MLTIIGLGLKPKDISLQGLEELKKASRAYVENYTSSYAEGNISKLEELAGKQFELLDRKMVEEGFSQILEDAKKLGLK